jgi:anti-sigma factor ChrR (cupin superfamily)
LAKRNGLRRNAIASNLNPSLHVSDVQEGTVFLDHSHDLVERILVLDGPEVSSF